MHTMRKFLPIETIEKNTLIYNLNIAVNGAFIKILITYGRVDVLMPVHENTKIKRNTLNEAFNFRRNILNIF